MVLKSTYQKTEIEDGYTVRAIMGPIIFHCLLILKPLQNFLGHLIYMSNTTEKEGRYVCYHANNHLSLAMHLKTTAYCCTVGRYVTYQHITRDLVSTTNLGFSAKAQIALREVEVFGK